MNLQQLRYVIAIAEGGSINSVAKSHYISQSSLSVAMRDLESELGITIFNRSSKGITLTSEGVEFLGYARQVVEQADLLEQRYDRGSARHPKRLAVSSQHYAFAVRALIEFVSERAGDESCEFSLRETRTAEIIRDVTAFRSDIGILYLSGYNEVALRRRLDEASLTFTPLFRARPHVFVREGHPLARLGTVRVADLEPYPRYTFEQGAESSLYFSEEPLSALPHNRQITASDRGTMTSLLTGYDGFLVSTGVMSDEMFSGIVSLPLETDEVMNVGYITHSERRLSGLALDYVGKLERLIVGFGDETCVVPSRATQKAAADGAADGGAAEEGTA